MDNFCYKPFCLRFENLGWETQNDLEVFLSHKTQGLQCRSWHFSQDPWHQFQDWGDHPLLRECASTNRHDPGPGGGGGRSGAKLGSGRTEVAVWCWLLSSCARRSANCQCLPRGWKDWACDSNWAHSALARAKLHWGSHCGRAHGEQHGCACRSMQGSNRTCWEGLGFSKFLRWFTAWNFQPTWTTYQPSSECIKIRYHLGVNPLFKSHIVRAYVNPFISSIF